MSDLNDSADYLREIESGEVAERMFEIREETKHGMEMLVFAIIWSLVFGAAICAAVLRHAGVW